MRKILLWIYLNIMPSAETILVIDVPMRSSRDLGWDTFTITPMSGPMHLSWFRPIQCFRISADAISSVVFGKSAEIRWLDVIGHLYTSGLAMLSVGFDWIMSEIYSLPSVDNNSDTCGNPLPTLASLPKFVSNLMSITGPSCTSSCAKYW